MLLLDKCKRKERMNYMNEFEKVLIDSQKEVGKSNKRKDKIIVLLIVLMFLEAIVGILVLFGMKVSSIM